MVCGEFARTVALHREMLPQTSVWQKPFFKAHMAIDLLEWGKLDEALHLLDEAQTSARTLNMARLGVPRDPGPARNPG
jgi:ActR/RegA family two-component response regulator